jgi:nitronate monooxygenase
MRMFYGLKSIWQLKRSSLDEKGDKDYWQAGKSAGGIDRIDSCESIMQELISGES